MSFSMGIVGAGQFSGSFASLFKSHPGITNVYVTDLLPERAEALNAQFGLDGTYASFDALLASDVDAVGIFTQRWTHGPLVVKALRAGKHVYSAVPMAISRAEIAEIIRAVEETGLTYMMGETSYYNPATVFAREKVAAGEFGRLVYAEGDYMHDMDLGFYKAYQHSGGDNWRATASYPPMLYPTHAIGGVLGHGRPTRSASAASAFAIVRTTVCSTGRSVSSTTTSPTRARCSHWPTAARCAPTRCAASDIRPRSASLDSDSSELMRASNSLRDSPCGRTSAISSTSLSSCRPNARSPRRTGHWSTSTPTCAMRSSRATLPCTIVLSSRGV